MSSTDVGATSKKTSLTERLLDPLLIVAAAAALFLIWRLALSPGGAWVVVAASGAAVGTIELLGRYPYAPLRAVFSGSGLVYVFINLLAAIAALHLVGEQGFAVFKDTAAPLRGLYELLTAGFGALVFMRSSVFKARVGDAEVGVGPAALLDTVLMIADRGVDRQEAALRAQEVTNLLKGVDPVRGGRLLAAYCIALMQNVSPEEQKRLEEKVTRIASDTQVDQAIRLDLIALQLSNIVGPNVLEAAVNALGERLKDPKVAQTVALPQAVPPVPPPPPAGATAIPVPSAGALLGELDVPPPNAPREPATPPDDAADAGAPESADAVDPAARPAEVFPLSLTKPEPDAVVPAPDGTGAPAGTSAGRRKKPRLDPDPRGADRP
jgi:hypothetical protein